jgi:hypothetical protein
LDEEKSKHASLFQQNGFGPTFLHTVLRLIKGIQQSLTPTPEECNEYDLTTVPVFYLSIIMIGPGALLLVVSHLFAVALLVFIIEVEKK